MLLCELDLKFLIYCTAHFLCCCVWCPGLTKFIEQAKLFPETTQYDLIAAYCQSSANCSEILQILESLGTSNATKTKANSANISIDQDSAHKVCKQLV